jgi:hypothetical protein
MAVLGDFFAFIGFIWLRWFIQPVRQNFAGRDA